MANRVQYKAQLNQNDHMKTIQALKSQQAMVHASGLHLGRWLKKGFHALTHSKLGQDIIKGGADMIGGPGAGKLVGQFLPPTGGGNGGGSGGQGGQTPNTQTQQLKNADPQNQGKAPDPPAPPKPTTAPPPAPPPAQDLAFGARRRKAPAKRKAPARKKKRPF